MRTRYDTSPWIHEFPESRRPNLPACTGEHRAQVAIVGAGLTGCATAYVFAAAGVPVIVLEADRIGRGASGHAAGLLLPDPGPSFVRVQALLGRRAARTMFQVWRRATLDAAATLRRLRVPCGLEPVDAIDAAFTPDEERRLLKELAARSDAGLDGSSIRRQALARETALEARLGARTRDAFALDPYRACVGLARAARARGAAVFERSPVTRVAFGPRDVEIRTARAELRADIVIVATGVATAEFRALRRHFALRETYMVLTEPVPGALRRRLGSAAAVVRDLREPRHRIRWVRDRLLVAGADQPPVAVRARDAVLVQRTGQLMYELLTMYPVIQGLQPEYGWSAVSGDTVDGLPYIGSHRNFPRHLFALGGGDSLSSAFLAARLLLRRYQDAPDKTDHFWTFTRG